MGDRKLGPYREIAERIGELEGRLEEITSSDEYRAEAKAGGAILLGLIEQVHAAMMSRMGVGPQPGHAVVSPGDWMRVEAYCRSMQIHPAPEPTPGPIRIHTAFGSVEILASPGITEPVICWNHGMEAYRG